MASDAKVEVIGTSLYLTRPNTAGQLECWQMVGTDLGAVQEAPGTLYIEHGRIIYIDYYGHKRMLAVTASGATAAIRPDSSLSADPYRWLWYAWQKQKYGMQYSDYAHGDHDDYADEDSSGQEVHEDRPQFGYLDHGDYEDIGAYIDTHSDWTDPPSGHGDQNVPIHENWGDASTHDDWSDTPEDHGDHTVQIPDDHIDSYADWSDVPNQHGDQTIPIHDDRPSYSDWTDSIHDDHGDESFYEDWPDDSNHSDWDDSASHGDWDDTPHVDWDDGEGQHDDTYNDYTGEGYSNWTDAADPHSDTPAAYNDWPDVAHANWSDAGDHGDSHSDENISGYYDIGYEYADWDHADRVYYQDSSHMDYSDHGDDAHADNPKFIGYV